ncbi:MAG: DnaD domain protein [Clostridiales Family XIII bacterium]|jgi:DnaD/phage-associated family protein|nr:DnaD domain protein [Clostridiales Family XIII bacterium]
MNFKREQSTNYFLDDTSVPNIFIAEYMPDAPGNFVKVYLYAFMYSGINHLLSNASIAKSLGMGIEEVLAAWTYFEECGMVRKVYPDSRDKLRYDVIFTDLKSGVFSRADAGARKTGSFYGTIPDDTALKDLFLEIERITGRPIPGGDYQKIGGILEDYGVGTEIVACAYRHCVERGKRAGASYVGGIVRDWAERDLRTREDVMAYLDGCDFRHDQHKRIMKELGLSGSALTDAERKVFDTWLDDMNLSLENILEACKKAAGKNNKFAYVKKIVESDFEKAGGSVPSASDGKISRKRFYEDRRRDSEEAARKRVAEVYEKCPGIKGLDAEITNLNMDLVGAMVSGADNRNNVVAKIRQRIERKLSEKEALMKNAGFAPDYMDILYHCPLCKDTGLLDNGVSCSCFKISPETM